MRRFGPALALALALAACGKDPPPAAPGGPGSLSALLRDLVDENEKGDAPRLRDLALSVIPTSDELRRVLRPGPDADAFVARYEPKDVAGGDARLDAMVFVGPRERGRTEVLVHSATTEALARYEPGTTAAREFESGMRRFAERVAAPGRTWWSAELREPGRDQGTRFTCFTRVDDRWILIVRPWQSLPASSPSDDVR